MNRQGFGLEHNDTNPWGNYDAPDAKKRLLARYLMERKQQMPGRGPQWMQRPTLGQSQWNPQKQPLPFHPGPQWMQRPTLGANYDRPSTPMPDIVPQRPHIGQPMRDSYPMPQTGGYVPAQPPPRESYPMPEINPRQPYIGQPQRESYPMPNIGGASWAQPTGHEMPDLPKRRTPYLNPNPRYPFPGYSPYREDYGLEPLPREPMMR